MQESAASTDRTAQLGVAQHFVGYRVPVWASFAHHLAAVLTVGLSLLACRVWPHLRLWTQRHCSLRNADYVRVELVNGQHVVVKVQIISPPGAALRSRKSGSQPTAQRRLRILLFDYVYTTEQGTFVPVPDMPSDLSSQLLAAHNDLHDISLGASWDMLSTARAAVRRERAHMYGLNDMSIGRPSFVKMAGHAFSSPMYLLQYLELAYLMYLTRYTYAGILYLISFWANLAGCQALYKKRMEMYTAIRQCRLVPLVQAGHVRAISSRRLVPGDVLVVLKGRATCDMALLRGSCLVEESMLSGEVDHVRKSSYVPSRQGYHPESHHHCTVHAGTVVQQVWNEEDGEDEVLAMVVRTGLRTTSGNLLRQIVCPVHAAESRQNTFVIDLLKFYFFAFLLQLGIFMLYLAKASKHTDDAQGRITRAVDVLIAAAPTGAPTVVVAALTYCILHLKSQELQVLLPDKVKTIADVEVVCFDKTGTLTGATPSLHGMLPAVGGQFSSLQKSAAWWPARLCQAVAVCNSLTFVRKNKVVGDATELKMCKSVEAHFVDRNEVNLPLHDQLTSVRTCILHIRKRFEFDPTLLRSGVLVQEANSKDGSALLFVRGSTNTIGSLLHKKTMPSDYAQAITTCQKHYCHACPVRSALLRTWLLPLSGGLQQSLYCSISIDQGLTSTLHPVVNSYASQGFRLLSIAVGVVHGTSKMDFTSMSLPVLEKQAGHMHLLGLVVMTNHLRPDSRDTITHLQNRGGMQTMMVTGDYHYTATSIARQAGMIHPDRKVMLIQAESEFRSQRPDSILSQSKYDAEPTLQSHAAGGTCPDLMSSHQASSSPEQMPTCDSHSGQPMHPAEAKLLPSAHSERLSKVKSAWETHDTAHVQSMPASHSPSTSTGDAQHSMGSRRGLWTNQQGQIGNWQAPVSASQGRLVQSSGHAAKAQRHVGFSPQGCDTAHERDLAHDRAQPCQDNQPVGQEQPDLESSSTQQLCQGLRVSLEGSAEAFRGAAAHEALTSIAQGQVQCCVTGSAFAHLLQQADTSLLQAVMQNVAVFARMQSRQKGQVMELLGARGLHQVIRGQQRHIEGLGKVAMYCGDGINDLAALAVADVGIAVGSSDAAAAASVVTKRHGIASVCTVLREARAGQAIKLNAVKYMVVYQLLLSLCNNSAYFLDGSGFSFNQIRILDFMAISMGIVAGVRPAALLLQPGRPARSLCTFKNYLLVSETILISCFIVFGCATILVSQPWYTGGNGQHDNNPVTTALWMVACCQIITPMFSFSIDCAPFCNPRSRPDVLVEAVYVAVVSLGCMLGPHYMFQGHGSYFDLPFSYRYKAFATNVFGAVMYAVGLQCTRLFLSRRSNRIAPIA